MARSFRAPVQRKSMLPPSPTAAPCVPPDGTRIAFVQPPANLVSHTLTGGTWFASGTGVIEFPKGTSIRTNAAEIELVGSEAGLETSEGKDALYGLSLNDSGGTLRFANGRTVSQIDFENRGDLESSASTFNVASHFANSGHVTIVDGGSLSVAAASGDVAQYADELIAFSSQYDNGNYAATQALGPPDATGYGGYRVWVPQAQNGTTESITLGFSRPVHATGVTIREARGNGFVTQVEVRDEASGDYHTVFSGTDPTAAGALADFPISFAATAFLVDAVRITIDTNLDTSAYEAIDAVQLHWTPPLNDGVYAQSAGSTTVDSTLTVTGGVSMLGGTLGGTGDVQADVINTGGTVAPGNSPGILDIYGDYTQSADATLLLELAGRDPDVPEFDRLRVTGIATLDGTARVELLDAFEPAPGDEFRVLSAAVRLGQFATHDFPTPGGTGRRINPIYDGTGLTLQTQVVPPLDFAAATTGGDETGQLAPEQVVFDLLGNSYVTGSFQGTVDFDREHTVAGDTLTSTGSDGFVAAYDAEGTLALGSGDRRGGRHVRLGDRDRPRQRGAGR